MNTASIEHSELLRKLEDYSLDDPGSLKPFSKRLAHENCWTYGYALRAIEEYKRFAFLSVVAGHPVSPSDEIDQVWHLHLQYTEEYWGRFCPNILGKPLHHGPSKGGAEESMKFEDWYAKTKASYARFFGHAPPHDIWPPMEARVGEEFMRVNVREHVVIKKSDFPVVTSLVVAVLELFTKLKRRKERKRNEIPESTPGGASHRIDVVPGQS